MKITDVTRDLLTLKDSHTLLHCISLDCEMGAGIARSINNTFPRMKGKLIKLIRDNAIEGPIALYYDRDNDSIINMVTKLNYWDKPSYIDFEKALRDAAKLCKKHNVTKLAMPKIGCGLDRLDWRIVRCLIEIEFADMDIEIIICHL